MNDNQLIEKAVAIACEAHKGQVDKAGKAYITHPLRVAMRCSTDDERIVALLHDTIEDTFVTADYLLREGFSDRLVEAVLSVTRREEETYEQFVERCALNAIGRQVKIHDLEDNMDLSRLDYVTDDDLVRLQKYQKAYRFLTE